MRALTFAGELRLRSDWPVPIPAPGEALLRVRMAGICGTDIEITRGYKRFEGVLGHEYVATVEEAHDRNLIDRRVCGEINVGCGHCQWCAAGVQAHCPDRTVTGILDRDGCFADYLVVPERNLHIVPESLSDVEATMVEPLAAAFEVLEGVDVDATQSVLVLGDGRLGSLCALVLKSVGCDPLVLGRHEEKLSVLSGCGLRTVLAQATLQEQFDLVVEATGSASGVNLALETARPRGTVVLKTTVAGLSEVDLSRAVVKELTLVGSRCGPFARALHALERREIDVRPLVSTCYRFDDAPVAFQRAQDADVMKVLLDMTAE